MRPLLRALCALALFSPLCALAQYRIATITFHNPGPYTTPELLSATGLHSGQPLGQLTLVDAAKRLLNTGLFSDATFDYTGYGKTRDILIDLKPIPLDKLLPASFENLVWFTPDELTAGIHARVPLYRGVASDAGTLPDDIQSALQQMLAAKGITATLSHAIIEPTTQHPRLTVNFKVDSPRIVVAKADIAGIPAALQPATLQTLQRLQGAPYNEGLTGFTIQDIVLIPARIAGYPDARLENVQRTFTSTANTVAVTYTAIFVPGDAYKRSTVTWTPTPLYTAADFARDSELHPGDPASDEALRHTEAAISRAYLRAGYIDVYVLPHPVPDPSTHTIAYNLTVVPGEIYHLQTLNVVGLSSEATQQFNADWQLKPGDPYSDLAVNAFLIKHAAQPAFRGYTPAFKAVGDPQTHQVDLTLTFTPNGSRVY